VAKKALCRIWRSKLSWHCEQSAPPRRWRGLQIAKGDFAFVLMITAVVGAACQVVAMVFDIGRSSGWWP
jgi:hypothetical protein